MKQEMKKLPLSPAFIQPFEVPLLNRSFAARIGNLVNIPCYNPASQLCAQNGIIEWNDPLSLSPIMQDIMKIIFRAVTAAPAAHLSRTPWALV